MIQTEKETEHEESKGAGTAHSGADTDWESAEILAAMQEVKGISFDAVSQIRLPSGSRGKIALVGDACSAPPYSGIRKS